MTALLTDNLPLLAGAPNGIKKLRELILELAVRGKLVPQDPSDEPASELLKRITDEKAQLLAEGKIKKQKQLAAIGEKEEPFDLPKGWAWQRFGEIFSLEYGNNLPADKRSNTGEYPVYGSNGVVGTHNECFVSSPCIVVGRKGSAGALNLCLAQGCCVTDVAYYCIPPSACLLDYVFKLFHTLGLGSLGKGIKPGLNRNEAYDLVVAVPPFSEQYRIVAKVDELMALCDRLEAQQADAESAHIQLVQALLNCLTQASDANEFAANWQRLAEHFHTLFTTEPSIDALKQTLLQLAVMGKLVPQDPSDKPANELLKDIQSSRADKRKIVMLAEEAPVVERLPVSWTWSSIDQLSADDPRAITDGPFGANLKTEHYIDAPGFRVVRLQNIGNGEFRDEHRAYISQDQFEKITKHQVFSGDLLVAGLIDTSIRCCSVPENIGPAVVKADCYRFSVHPLISPKYALYYLNSKMAHEFAAIHHHGLTLTRIGLGNFRSIPVPLPPTAEQHRIVAKVDQLMTLCDQLKTRLTLARQLNEQLASTLVERALACDAQQSPVAADQKTARTLLAAEIAHQLHGQRTFGQRKLQKVIYLAEHAARLKAIQGNYLRNVAGPHDRHLMSQVESELFNRRWYERIERETVGHAYRPLPDAGHHRQDYESLYAPDERATVQQTIDLMRGWDTDRCERVVTLYAAWNDFLLEGKAITDEALVEEVMYRWNDAKLRFTQGEWLADLRVMKAQPLLTPSGFGRRTQGGSQTLPGFH